MAGDWLKMRSNLWDDPRVGRIVDMTESTEGAVIGALYWLWATADQHTEDGHLPGMSLRQIDRKTSLPGFGAALVEVGWLVVVDGGVTIQRFEEHNGTSAKRRCTDAQRKANGRNVSASDADKTRTDAGTGVDEKRRTSELEKRREESSEPNGSGSAVAAPPVDNSNSGLDTADDSKRVLWNQAKDWLVANSVTAKDARTFVNTLAKENPGVIEAALREAITTPEPGAAKDWLAGIVRRMAEDAARADAPAALGAAAVQSTQDYLRQQAQHTPDPPPVDVKAALAATRARLAGGALLPTTSTDSDDIAAQVQHHEAA